MFLEIKVDLPGPIDFHSLRRFFVGQGIIPFDHEIIEVLRRIDKDDDGTVSRGEFEEFLTFVDSVNIRSTPSASEREIKRETTVTREAKGPEVVRETVTRTVDRDDFIRSPRTVTSVRRLSSPERVYTTTIRDSAPDHRVYTTEVSRPVREEIVVEREIPARPVTRTYRTVRRSVSPEREVVVETEIPARPVTRTYRTVRRSVSPEREVVVETEIPARGLSRTYRSVRRSVSPEREVVVETEIPRRPVTRTYRTVRRSVSTEREVVVETEIARPSSRSYRNIRRSIHRSPAKEEITYETEIPARGYPRTYRTIRRSVSPDKEVVETEETQYTSHPRRSISRGRTTHQSRSRKNLEDIEYSSWLSRREPAPRGTQDSVVSRRSSKDLGASLHSSSRRSIHKSKSFDLTSDFISYLRLAARLESELDSLKQELCLRPDYSSLDHFRCIDTTGRGYIRESDLGLFLRDIDPSITPEYIHITEVQLHLFLEDLIQMKTEL